VLYLQLRELGPGVVLEIDWERLPVSAIRSLDLGAGGREGTLAIALPLAMVRAGRTRFQVSTRPLAGSTQAPAVTLVAARAFLGMP
jgi:hypothetical protein